MSVQPKWYAYTLLGATEQDGEEDHPSLLSRRTVSRRFVWLEISLAISIMALSLLTLVESASAQGTFESATVTHRTYLPMLSTVGAEPANTEPANIEPSCDLLPQEQSIADSMANHPDQGRPTLYCNSILTQVAREHATDMGVRGYFDHVSPDGYGPNYLVTQAGYALPGWYSQEESANNIESIGAGYPSAAAVWQAWMDSQYHRAHLLGSDSFYGSQLNYGIGYAFVENSPYEHYYVVVTAPPP